MCTTITDTIELDGSAKGARGWFTIDRANLGYDHPFHADMDHALTLDFVSGAGLEHRVAVELTLDAARSLLGALAETVELAEAYEV
jgi:Family of unknown function (DUF6295)